MDSIFNTWVDGTTRMTNDWRRMTEGWSGNKWWENAGKMQQQWMDSYQELVRKMGTNTSGNAFSNDTTREAFSNMLKSMDIYTRLFQLWQPVMGRMQEQAFNPQEFWKMIDPMQFRRFTDNLFGIDQQAMMQSFMDQYNRLMPFWMNTMNQASQTFGQQFSNVPSFFAGMWGMDPQRAGEWASAMGRTVQRSFFPYFTQTGAGAEPSGAPFAELTGKWSDYMSKASQMQNMLYQTGMSAWEETARDLSARMQEGRAFSSFDEFYNHWATINEKAYMTLFNTPEYAQLQSEVLSSQSELARLYEQGMENMLQPYPVVLRSQLDDAYKTMHELRNRINDLERQLAELQRAAKSGNRGDKASTKE